MKKINFINKYFELARPEYVYFRLIPHSSSRNNSTDKLAQLINKLYINLNERIYKEGKKIRLKMDSKVSYYIYMEKGKAEFYFIVPKEYMRLFKERIGDTWKNVEIQEVQQLPGFSKGATKYSLSCKKEDALSLAVDKRNNELLSSNLSVLDILESDKNDKIGIIYNFLPSSPSVLSSFKQYHRETIAKFRKNAPLEKNKMSIAFILKSAFMFLLNTIDGLLEFTQNKLDGYVSNVPMLNERTISIATKKKETATICRSQIVVLSESDNESNQVINAKAMSESFGIIGEEQDNELIYDEIKKDFDILDYSFPTPINQTSTSECTSFIALPGRELLKEHAEIEHLKVLENPVPEELRTGFFRLGNVKVKDSSTKAYKSNDKQLSRLGLAYLGCMGAGKTTAMTNNALDIIQAGHGLFCVDIINNCELADSIRAVTPPERLVEIDCSNPSQLQAFAYNEIKVTKNMSANDKVCNATLKTQQIEVLINSINTDTSQLSPKMLRYLYSAGVVVFAGTPDAGFINVIECLSSFRKRHTFIDRLDMELYALLESDIEELRELDKLDSEGNIIGNADNKVEGILDRTIHLKTSAFTKLAFAKGSVNNLDFKELIRDNKVVLIKVPEAKFPSKLLRNVIATFYISKIWLGKQLLSAEKQQQKTFLLFDEFYKCHNVQLLFEDIFVEARKFDLVPIVALHYLNQLNADCKESLKASGASYILLQGADVKAYHDLKSNLTQFGYTEDDLLNLERYHAIALMKTTKNYSAFIVQLPKPVNNNVLELKERISA